MSNTLFGRIHLAGMILQSIYGYFPWIPFDTLDKIYLLQNIAIPISWILCKDECILSYIIKKRENPDYILGSEPYNVKDITDLFPENPVYYQLFHHINHMVRIGSLIIVNHRASFVSTSIWYPFLSVYTLYIYDITYQTNYRKRIGSIYSFFF
jgi:hypothetical protein